MNVIQFYSPVTVIVGVNGTGKTTIIECLKYATTGELPPNTKGGAFVHDPKMAGEKEVKAQVRLRFWNVKRERMVATRNLQVTVKKAGGLTMKTLEGILSKVDGVDAGEKRNAISTKCAEMDAEVPRLMGVSTAILDNVIFCHQEESNWPLSEPAALKKKFDDIFEASKFTKALDHIKSLRKDRVAALKVDAERLNFLKQDRDKAESLKRDLERQRTEIGRKEADSERLTQRHDELTKANAEFYQSSTKFTEIFEKAETLNSKKEMIEGNRNNLKKHIKTMMKETDEELRAIMQNFNEDKDKIDNKIKEKRVELDRLEANYRAMRAKHGKEGQRMGELTANRKRYDRNANERENLIHSQAEQYDISGFNGKLTRDKAEQFIAILQDSVARSRETCARIEAEGRQTDRTLQDELNKLRAEQQSKKNLRDDRQRQMNDAKTQSRTAELEVDSFSTIDSDIKRLEKEIKSAVLRIERANEEIDEAKFDEKLRELGLEIRRLESDREEMNIEYRELQKHAEARANLNAARNNLTKVQTRIDEAVKAHGPKYLELTEEQLDPSTMEEPLIIAQRRFDGERDNVTKEKQKLVEKRNRLESEIALHRESIERLATEASRTTKDVSDLVATLSFTDSHDLDEVLAKAQYEISWREERLGIGSYDKHAFFKEILDRAKEEHICIGCNRGVKDSDLPALEAYITKKLTKKSKNREALQSDLDDLHITESKIKALMPKAEAAKQALDHTIPESEERIGELEVQVRGLRKKIEDVEAKESLAISQSKAVAALRAYFPVMERDLSEAEELRRQISSAERALENTGSTRSNQEVVDDLARLDKQIKAKTDDRMRAMAERDQLMGSRLQDEKEVSDKKLSLSETKNKQAIRKQAEMKIEELRDVIKTLTIEMADLEKKHDDLDEPIKTAEIRLRTSQQKWNRELNEARRQLELYSQSAADIKQISEEMRRYEEANGDKLLEDCERAVRDLEKQLAQLDSDISDLQQEIADLRNDLASSDQRAQNIDNNILYRQAERQIQQLQVEIESIDLEEAARAKSQFDTKYKKAERERTETYAKLQQMVGEISQMKEQAKRMQRQLETDYKNIHGEYIDCLVKWKTGDMANRDLEKYAKALDNGETGMGRKSGPTEELTLEELWREVYAGTDIDSIQIVSESDATSTGTRKSYHYRLVMRKGDQMLDMRGRCSAGQKVLASILVRLALAESFAQQCGVLALDEPTTNLDVDNIEALANSLAGLIDRMKSMKNFQLIVITHDESFLQRLAGNSNAFEYYWRVSRNAEQKSIVERQRVVVEY
ncbi:DNA repair protein rad50 [Naganishia albida]|nr:DNA repair protein rad50 [Naganishia albida]